MPRTAFTTGLLALGISLLLTGCPGPQPIPDPPPDKKPVTRTADELPMVPKETVEASGVEQFEVDGLKVILKRTAGRPVVSAQLYIDGGVGNLDDKTAGIESLALSVAVSGGTTKTERDAFKSKLNAMGSSIGASSNRDYSSLSMRSIKPYWGDTWKLFCEVITGPAFDEKQLELDRKQVIEAIKAETESPEEYMSLTATELFFEGHPYGLRTQGTIPNVTGFTRDQIMEYFKVLLTRERLTLVVVGDLDREALEGGIRGGLHGLPKGEYKRRDLDKLAPGPAALKVNEKKIATNYMLGYFTAPAPTESDYYAMLVALNILRGRLFEEVRTKRNLTYAVASGLGSRPYNYGYLYATPVDPNTTVKVMYDEVAKIQDVPVGAKELSDQIEVFLTRHYMGQETNAAQASTLGHAELSGGGWEQSLVFIERIKSVTPDDIQRVSKGYIKNIHWGIVGDPKAADPAIFTSR